MSATEVIVNTVVLAAVAAGAIGAVIYLFPTLSFPWNAVATISLGAALGVIAIATLIRVISRPKYK